MFERDVSTRLARKMILTVSYIVTYSEPYPITIPMVNNPTNESNFTAYNSFIFLTVICLLTSSRPFSSARYRA